MGHGVLITLIITLMLLYFISGWIAFFCVLQLTVASNRSQYFHGPCPNTHTCGLGYLRARARNWK